jgi:drug/metabolite transporter (DMT)-like permease
MSHAFIAAMIAFTLYGQVVLKWKVGVLAPEGLPLSKPAALSAILLNPWVISAFASAFLASICWMAALSRMPLSKAYPFTALSFPLILLLSWGLFREPLTAGKIAGTLLICLGIIVVSRS